MQHKYFKFDFEKDVHEDDEVKGKIYILMQYIGCSPCNYEGV